MEKTIKILHIIYNTCHIVKIKKIYVQAFTTNTFQPMLYGSCGDQMKKDRTVKDIKLKQLSEFTKYMLSLKYL
jgi:hypothetical protein